MTTEVSINMGLGKLLMEKITAYVENSSKLPDKLIMSLDHFEEIKKELPDVTSESEDVKRIYGFKVIIDSSKTEIEVTR